MGKVVFNVNRELIEIVEHTLAQPEETFIRPYSVNKEHPAGQQMEPHLLLVHDQGIYLMSGSNNKQEREDRKKGESLLLVSYALTCNPDIDQDWWENARALVGGDDFGETIPLRSFVEGFQNKAKSFIFEFTESTYRMGYVRSAEAAPYGPEGIKGIPETAPEPVAAVAG